uniref:2-oxoglutarate dehydrogenase, mitochondrial n=1 Tax=Theileria annulata TaxID=5874 RepID=A0A3B0N436_THEAN
MRSGLIRIGRQLRQFENFHGESSNYLEYLYYVYRTNPEDLQPSWQNYFSLLEQGKKYILPQIDRKLGHKYNGFGGTLIGNQATSQATELFKKVSNGVVGLEALKLNELASAYRTYGHLISTLDPLKLPKEVPFFRNINGIYDKLNAEKYFNKEDLTKKIPNLGLGGVFNMTGTVEELVNKLKDRYCGNISFEFGHIANSDEVAFLINEIENDDFLKFNKEDHLKCFTSICKAVKFEQFCAKTFPTLKRFGMDGIETLLLLLQSIEESGRNFGINSIMMTMSHRGRLNILCNFLDKPFQESFAEFRGANWFINSSFRSGDVKYHNGYRTTKNGVEIQMISNSSHLQFSHPVLTGLVKAKQYYENDTNQSKILPIAVHGNSAISGQGMPYEVVQMSKIDGYGIGGTINIIVNNQIGFTANQLEASSSRYPSDVGKVIDSPIIHVNAYSIESVMFAGKLSTKYRYKFKNDVFINLVGFRRFGHNELDMPKFTNAEMYSKVDETPNLMVYYKNYLENLGFDRGELDEIENSTGSDFLNSLNLSKQISRTIVPVQNENWLPIATGFSGMINTYLRKNKSVVELLDKTIDSDMKLTDSLDAPVKTGIDKNLLLELGTKCVTVPSDIKMHNSVKKIFDARLQCLSSGLNFDTAMSEILAFSSLANEGFHVRLSGQESKRGTFSHRHSHVQCQTTFKYHNVFEGFDVSIYNSYLSELAAMGFEYGYSLYSPKTLNIWEAQFGDFVNGAQVIVDAFVTSAETKWNYFSGLVLFLPHGYDGQGPDHSSSRVERFLQLSNDNEDLVDNLKYGDDYAKLVNISVVNCSVASNFFHVLRRQMHRSFRKPMICITGKKLLKLRSSFSTIDEYLTGTKFRRYIPDNKFTRETAEVSKEGEKARNPDQVKRMIMCTGQIYYDLLEYREENEEWRNVPIARMEEITPFPAQHVLDDLKRFKNLETLVWCQEEHENSGCFYFLRERLNNVLKMLKSEGHCPKVSTSVKYSGRYPCATTAVGDPKMHEHETVLVKQAFTV